MNSAHSRTINPPRSAGSRSQQQGVPNRNSPAGNSKQRSVTSPVSYDGVYKNPRFSYQLAKHIGCQVHLMVTNGKTYDGILKTFSPRLDIVLECAHLCTSDDKIPTKDELIKTLVVSFDDLVSMTVPNADCKFAETDSFTDSAISRTQSNGSQKEIKELTPWDGGGEGSELHLEDGLSNRGWNAEDMFRCNEEQFGVKSDYDENLTQYTTQLKRENTKEYLEKQEKAERLALEIEQSAISRNNTELENGDDGDEEAKFSAVIRPNESSPTNRPGDKSSQNKSTLYRRGNSKVQGSREPMQSTEKADDKATTQYLKKFQSNFNLITNVSQQTNDSLRPVQTDQSKVSKPLKPRDIPHNSSKPPPATSANEVVKTDIVTPMHVTATQSSPAAEVSDAASAGPVATPVNTTPSQPPFNNFSPIPAVAENQPAISQDSKSLSVKSTLNAEAKEFVPKSKVAAPIPQTSNVHNKQHKAASVSLNEVRKHELPTVAQASGPPLINNSQYPIPPAHVYPPPMMNNRMPRVYPEGGQVHYPQQFHLPGVPAAVQPQQPGNVPPPTPPTSHSQPIPAHAPPVAVNQTLQSSNGQHLHHPNPSVYSNHQGSQPVSYYTVNAVPSQQQPPLNPSPHNHTAASPVTMHTGPMAPYTYHPAPQQFAQQYFTPQPQIVNGSMPGPHAQMMYYQQMLGQFPQYPGYFYAVPGTMQQNYPPQ